jgi:hypothetical protein
MYKVLGLLAIALVVFSADAATAFVSSVFSDSSNRNYALMALGAAVMFAMVLRKSKKISE